MALEASKPAGRGCAAAVQASSAGCAFVLTLAYHRAVLATHTRARLHSGLCGLQPVKERLLLLIEGYTRFAPPYIQASLVAPRCCGGWCA